MVFLFSCSEERRKAVEKDTREIQPFIFNLEHFFSEEEFNISFPVWFNDTLIKHNGIETITRKVYTSSSEKDTSSASLKEIRTYSFTEEGSISDVHIEHYYDNIMVASMAFTFLERDEYGYSPTESRAGTNSKSDLEVLAQFENYFKEEYSDKFLAYSDMKTGDYLFYMLKEKNWGTLSVDSILNPTSHDLIVFGNPQKPRRKYQVENRVNEFNVVDYTYIGKGDNLEKIAFDKYPFHYERSILYNDKGRCSGFIDSTFSNEKYLTRRESMFHFEKNLPVRLIHENKSGKSEAGYYQFETFTYTFYE